MRSLFFTLLGILFFSLAITPSFPLKATEPTGGIGVILEFLPDKKIHRVRAVFQGSPAARARIQPGEEIVAINGTSTHGMSFDELGKRVRGEPGSTVTLTLRSPDSSVTREVPLTRVSQSTVSPLILVAPGAGSGGSSHPLLTPAEIEQVKSVIRRLKTVEEQKKMEKLLLELKESKIIKADFFKILKAQFP